MALTPKGVTDAITDKVVSNPLVSTGSSIIKAPTSVAAITQTSKNKLDNGTSTATSTGQPTLNSPKDTLDSLDGWNENVLNALQQASYRIRFYMAEDNPMLPQRSATYADFIKRMNSRKQTTLAATGVTGINILSLQMTTIPAPNKQTRSMSATTMTMVLKENMGVNFMNDLALGARNLKIRNLAQTPYFIEISFHGYAQDGTIVANACDSDAFPNGGVWLYQVGIQNIASELDDSGTKYTLTLFPYEQKIYDQNNLQLPESMSIEGRTIGDILNGVASRWNESIKQTYGFQANEYKFVIPKVQTKTGETIDVTAAPLVPDQDKFAHKRAYSMEPGSNDKIKVHLPRNMALNDIVEMVFANSKLGKTLGMDVTTTESFKGAVEKDPKAAMRECIIFRAECTADLMGGEDGNDAYDFSLENYMMSYTIHILPYYTQLPILDRQDVITSQDPKVQAQNGLNLRKRGYLSKRYDYLYSGLNTEVQHVDIKFNLKWQNALPRILGTNTTQEALAPQDKKNEDPRDVLIKQKAELDKANAELRKVKEKTEEHDLNQSEIARLTANNQKEEAEKLRKSDEASWSSFIKDRDSDEGKQRLSKAKDIQAKALAELEKARAKVKTARLEQINTGVKRTSLHEFGEDQSKDDTQLSYKQPVSFVQSNKDNKIGTIMNDYYTNDRSVFGAVLDQLYTPMADGMSQIAMDVRGDPYWLGASNFESNYILAVRPADSVIRNFDAPIPQYMTRPNYLAGDVMFLLSFKYPAMVSETGIPEVKSNEFFTGVYQTTKITHKFEAGYFSQRLEGKRMPLIEVYKAFGYQDPDDVKAAAQAKAEADAAREKKNKS
jgi:hypothetical protein